jgi:hypothetical protein
MIGYNIFETKILTSTQYYYVGYTIGIYTNYPVEGNIDLFNNLYRGFIATVKSDYSYIIDNIIE